MALPPVVYTKLTGPALWRQDHASCGAPLRSFSACRVCGSKLSALKSPRSSFAPVWLTPGHPGPGLANAANASRRGIPAGPQTSPLTAHTAYVALTTLTSPAEMSPRPGDLCEISGARGTPLPVLFRINLPKQTSSHYQLAPPGRHAGCSRAPRAAKLPGCGLLSTPSFLVLLRVTQQTMEHFENPRSGFLINVVLFLMEKSDRPCCIDQGGAKRFSRDSMKCSSSPLSLSIAVWRLDCERWLGQVQSLNGFLVFAS